MYHTKKIALFISHIFGEYQKNVCQGVVDQAYSYGYQTEIYATADGEDLGSYGLGEKSILEIPRYNDFSGIIVASGTYPQEELKEQLLVLLQKSCSCPVIELTENNPRFPSVSLENNLTAGTLTEHLITVHNCKRICYLGCSAERFFSDQREAAYRTAMSRHALSVTDADIFLSDYSDTSAEQALASFTAQKDLPPDAVVCYNDRIALMFMAKAFLAGYHIPKDFALVGCDFTKEGQNVNPPLTTVTFPVYSLGTAAVDQLIHLIQKEEIPAVTTVFAEPHISASCGCLCGKETHPIFFGQELMTRIRNIEASMIVSMHMSAAFSPITDIDDGMQLLEQYVSQIKNCSEFYLCLYSGWDSVSSQILELTEDAFSSGEEGKICEDTILLKLAICGGKRLPECTFTRSSLLPEYIQKCSDSAYIISPLYFEQRAFGYVVLSYQDNQIDYHFQLMHWIMNITQLLQNICDFKHTQILTSRLEEIYMKDVLTGLYNYHGYTRKVQQMLPHTSVNDCISAFMFDVDGLKTINGHFGHNEGDFTLSVISQALEKSAGSSAVCCRFSGDEFYVLSNRFSEEECKDFMAHVEKYLANYNCLSEKPYYISVSCGYACIPFHSGMNEGDISALFHTADATMYQVKKTKKKIILR